MSRFYHYLRSKLLSKNKTQNSTSSAATDGHDLFQINNLPDHILSVIFLYIPSKDLLLNVSRVCKRWQKLIDNESFWQEKCLFDTTLTQEQQLSLRQLIFGSPQPVLAFKKISLINFFNKNLLKNGCGELGFQYWCASNSYFSELERRREEIYFRNVVIDKKRFKNVLDVYKRDVNKIIAGRNWQVEGKDKEKNFATSNSWTSKMQIIDLGWPMMNDDLAKILFAPPNGSPDGLKVSVSESYAARVDSGCLYQLRVFLVDNSFKIVDSFDYTDEFLPGTDFEWKSASHVFHINQPFRYILFTHAGSDIQCLIGFYGSKIRNGSVVVSI
jgi:hypothetical protein